MRVKNDAEQEVHLMKRLARRCVALNMGIVAVLFAGCGALRQAQDDMQPPVAVPGAMAHASWMLPNVERRNLLYVAQSGDGVSVYTYPGGRLVGSLGAFGGPFLCSDPTGNVFVPGGPIATQVSIYAHGAAQPTEILNSPYTAWGCSVDPSSERLAVTTYYQNTIVVFPYDNRHGWHFAKTFTDAAMEYIAFCAYDTNGNLFVDGVDTHGFSLAELAKGSDVFTAITLDKRISAPGSMQWDGKYLALADYGASSGEASTIYRFALNGTSGKNVSKTKLESSSSGVQFLIEGATVIGPMSKLSTRSIGFWRFPKGGQPVKSFSADQASGEAVSLK
jgi:hypothetical protein